jgi:transcriptional regulator with XRE-family HTH domain
MSISEQLLSIVLRSAKAAGLSQRALAKTAALAPETVSRAKTRPTIDLDTLHALASAVNLELVLLPKEPTATKPARTSSLADPKWGLAWSNRNASAQALVGAALAQGSFTAILEAVLEHGMPFVREQWASVCASKDAAPKPKIQPYVTRMLDNIEAGVSHAAP